MELRPSTFMRVRRLRSRAQLSFATSIAFSNSEDGIENLLDDTRRRRAVRDPKRRFLVVCEGKNSEPAYLRALARWADIIIDVIAAAGTPEVIAKKAIEEATSRGVIGRRRAKLLWYERTDEVWAVFDRDEHKYYEEALRLCEQNGIGIGRSNPCFEVWIVLHFEDFHRPDDRDKVFDHLCNLCPGYEEGKGKKVDFDELLKNLNAAEERAEAQLAARSNEGSEHNPPSTTFFMLTRSVRRKTK
ncbi:RloB family protein [Bradyrhizobium sp. Pha-3]|uniref:RloB family protein n=1 Tax=Bradyrhizobium sp. Pha-3 TaxID=208375 RepID=UPI0035D49AB9